MTPKPRAPYLDPGRPPPAPFTAYQWFVLITAPNREADVARAIEADGGFSLVPLETKQRPAKAPKGRNRSAGRRAKMEAYQRPWLPRTVFAGFAAPPNWLAVREIRHMQAVLEMAHRPAQLRASEVLRMRDMSEALRGAAVLGVAPIKPGGMAKLSAGLFSGKTVEIGALQGKYAIIRAMLDANGELVAPAFPLMVPVDDLEAAQ